MKWMRVIFLVAMSILLLHFCDETEEADPVGTLVFEATSTMPTIQSKVPNILNKVRKSEDYDVYLMHTKNLKFKMTEIWVSQDEVVAGQPDNLTWHKIGENDELMLFDDYYFVAEALPAGEYKSLKLVFTNMCARIAYEDGHPENEIEMDITMGWFPCGVDEVVPTNYFSAGGNHILNDIGVFQVQAEGEHIGGFEIRENKITRIYWKLGGNSDVPMDACSFEWWDMNKNGLWDCGIDREENTQCPPEVTVMWGFIVENE